MARSPWFTALLLAVLLLFSGDLGAEVTRNNNSSQRGGIIRNCKQGRGVGNVGRRCVMQQQRNGDVLGVNCSGGHKGCDLARASRSQAPPPVYAMARGRVVFAGFRRDYGNRVVIDEGNGRFSTYSHLKNFAVRRGDSVRAGTPLGTMGNTGQSNGIHLHLEVIVNGQLKSGGSAYAAAFCN